jgi:catechol 2,3-dioxygenase-like lactoylglutathione lyase family enzyme
MERSEEMTTDKANSAHTGVQITGVATIGVPVSDQDRAIEFYVGTLGLEKRLDAPMPGGGRWIMVAPPGRLGTTLALVAAHEGVPAGVDTGIRLTTPDADAAHTSLVAGGVEVGEVLRWPGVPAMFSFRDQDGNGLELIEQPE